MLFIGAPGRSVSYRALMRIIKYALMDKSEPTGKFFSEENNPETGEVPW